jgi:hypothetical protein
MLTITANGTRTCVGGWQLSFSGAVPGNTYRICLNVEHRELENVRGSLQSTAYWGELSATDSSRRNSKILSWEYLLPEQTGNNSLLFSRCLTVPERAELLTLRYMFRWTTRGESMWHLTQIEAVSSPASPDPVRIAVVTGQMGSRGEPFKTIQNNLDYYVPLREAACAEGPDLIVLPEIALQWRIPGSPLDLAVPAPGPETEAFAELARCHKVRIMLGMIERDGDAVHNSAVLIAPDGNIDGEYRTENTAKSTWP